MRIAWLGVLSLITIACESQVDATLAPVNGSALLDGKPLHRGTVITTTTAGRGARGQIDELGRFSLTTPRLGEGALIGSHQVAVIVIEEVPAGSVNPESKAKLAIPIRYAQTATSRLTIDVQPNQTNEVTLDLTSTTP